RERETPRQDERRGRTMGTAGGRHLERADNRRREEAGARLDRQHVYGTATDHERPRDSDGPGVRQDPLDLSAVTEGRLDRRLPAGGKQLRGERRGRRSRLRSGRLPDARETP